MDIDWFETTTIVIAIACQILLGRIAIERINADLYGAWDAYVPAYATVALMVGIVLAMLV